MNGLTCYTCNAIKHGMTVTLAMLEWKEPMASSIAVYLSRSLFFFLANARTDLLLHLEQTYSSFICLPEVVMMQTGFILLLTMAVKYLNALLFPGLQFFIACSSSDQNLELGKAWEQD